MHPQRKKAAIAKYGQQIKDSENAAEMAGIIRADEKKYTEEEIHEILKAVLEPEKEPEQKAVEQDPPKNTSKPSSKAVPASPNAHLLDQLAKIDYENLEGEAYQAYKKIEDRLLMNREYDFVQYMAFGVKKNVFDDNLNKTTAIVGIKINQVKPLNRTRIPAKYAANLNAQIWNSSPSDRNSRYYLLAKD